MMASETAAVGLNRRNGCAARNFCEKTSILLKTIDASALSQV